VIHAGIYYRPGSLKAESCVAGRALLYDYCKERRIEHRLCGKFIVAANDSQAARLEEIERMARRNGVSDLRWIDAEHARRCEPALSCTVALHSPSTGIVDSHGYMLSLLGDAESHGASIAYGNSVTGLASTSDGVAICIGGEPKPAVRCRILVNAAGLDAVRVAASIVDFPASHIPVMRYAKGNYFAIKTRAPFSRLIYPVPEPGGLGIHMTLDLSGHARFGPDVEWIEELDYDVGQDRVEKFYPAIRSYWPDLADGALLPAYSGIRPKLSGPGEPEADFIISGPRDHGMPGVINLFGIESPGLTASMALGRRVAMVAGGEL
jgi:L-2-hydroxyglutarate oxidase LhgO